MRELGHVIPSSLERGGGADFAILSSDICYRPIFLLCDDEHYVPAYIPSELLTSVAVANFRKGGVASAPDKRNHRVNIRPSHNIIAEINQGEREPRAPGAAYVESGGIILKRAVRGHRRASAASLHCELILA